VFVVVLASPLLANVFGGQYSFLDGFLLLPLVVHHTFAEGRTHPFERLSLHHPSVHAFAVFHIHITGNLGKLVRVRIQSALLLFLGLLNVFGFLKQVVVEQQFVLGYLLFVLLFYQSLFHLPYVVSNHYLFKTFVSDFIVDFVVLVV